MCHGVKRCTAVRSCAETARRPRGYRADTVRIPRGYRAETGACRNRVSHRCTSFRTILHSVTPVDTVSHRFTSFPFFCAVPHRFISFHLFYTVSRRFAPFYTVSHRFSSSRAVLHLLPCLSSPPFGSEVELWGSKKWHRPVDSRV